MVVRSRTQRSQRRTFCGNASSRITLSLATILCLSAGVLSQDNPFDCHVKLNNGKGPAFDLTQLAGVQTLSRTRETPPTTRIEEIRLDLCEDLPMKEGVAEGDQCPAGTRACLTVTNRKGEESSDRVVEVIPIAVASVLKPDFTELLSPKGLNVILHGSSYPNSEPIPQSLNVTLLCDTNSGSPEFTSYLGLDARIEWRHPAGCAVTEDMPPGGGGDGAEEDVGSGVGWFFLLLLLAFVAYFAIGAYYNYSTYGATGLDLIPHRDFWRDVPYIIKDVAAHLCATVRPKRGGYIAV